MYRCDCGDYCQWCTPEAFDIPAINNKLEALAIHLGVDPDADIESLDVDGDVHRYRHQGVIYEVAHSSHGLKADKLLNFNSNLWSLKIHDKNEQHSQCN